MFGRDTRGIQTYAGQSEAGFFNDVKDFATGRDVGETDRKQHQKDFDIRVDNLPRSDLYVAARGKGAAGVDAGAAQGRAVGEYAVNTLIETADSRQAMSQK